MSLRLSTLPKTLMTPIVALQERGRSDAWQEYILVYCILEPFLVHLSTILKTNTIPFNNGSFVWYLVSHFRFLSGRVALLNWQLSSLHVRRLNMKKRRGHSLLLQRLFVDGYHL